MRMRFLTGLLLLAAFCGVLAPDVSEAAATASFETPYSWFQKDAEPVHSGQTVWRETGWRNEKLQVQLLVSADRLIPLGDVEVEFTDLFSGADRLSNAHTPILHPLFVAGDVVARGCETPRSGEPAFLADALSETAPTGSGQSALAFYWLELSIPGNAPAGTYRGHVVVQALGDTQKLPIEITVIPYSIPDLRNSEFHLDLWQFPLSVLDRRNDAHQGHPIEPWSEEHYRMLEPSYRYLASLGQKVITTYVKDGALGAPSMIKWTYHPDENRMSFDYSLFDAHVERLMAWGITGQISAFSPVGWNKDSIPIEVAGKKGKSAIHAPIGSAAYRSAWTVFLADFRRHLTAKGWFDKTVLYMDEVPGSEMEQIVATIRNDDLRWKIGMAYSHVQPENVVRALYDVSGIFETEQQVATYPGQVTTFYTSCTQRRPNSYVAADVSPADNTAYAWYAIAREYDGYLRWAFDNWKSTEALDARDGTYTAGDFVFIYRDDQAQNSSFFPSVRSELLRDGIEDFEKWVFVRTKAARCRRKDILQSLDKSASAFTVEALSDGRAAQLLPSARKALDLAAQALIADDRCDAGK